ncbi:MAG: hypothetical protein ACRDK8_08830, partial [Solirubrobacteraceae bacterium]
MARSGALALTAGASTDPRAQVVLLTGQTLGSGQSITSPDGHYTLAMMNDGNLVLYTAAGAYWATHTVGQALQPGDELLPGQSVIAPGGRYLLQMGTDGVLRLIDSSGTVWASDGSPAGSYAVLQTNGDLEIRSTGGNLDWSTKTSAGADAGSTVQLSTDGDVSVVTPSGSAAWSSGTSATRSGLAYVGIGRSYTGCPATPTTTTSPTPIHAHASTSGSVTFDLPGVRVSISVRWRFN